jgi:hypothetical protein
VNDSETIEISLALPPLQAKALAHFVKRVDFETVARLSSVNVVADGKSEADLIWFALIDLRNALAEAGAVPRAADAAPRATPPRATPLTPVPGARQPPRGVVRFVRRAGKGGPGI